MKLENTEVWGFEHAIRGARNPLESWHKSDSKYIDEEYVIGDNDLNLLQRLTLAGTDHRKFMRQIMVSVDITAPEYWWLQFDTYKIGTTTNSTSKMHKLLAKPFTTEDFEFFDMDGYKKHIEQVIPEVDEDEEWKLYPYNHNYYISNYGRVYHKDYITTSGRLCKSKMLSNIKTNDGYLTCTILIDNKPKQKRVHRLVAETFLSSPIDIRKTEVNHINGNKLDNRLSNLEWCSPSENQLHAIHNHLQPQGLTKYLGKFSDIERQQIKEEYNSSNISKRKLAIKYGCSPTCINNILNDDYQYQKRENVFQELAMPYVKILNDLRDAYLTTEDTQKKKAIWRIIIQLLPMSYLQTRTVTMNYENLRNMYFARRNHKLSEWHVFCDWIKTLPYGEELICLERKNQDESTKG